MSTEDLYERYDELQDWIGEHITERGSPEFAAKSSELDRIIEQLSQQSN